MLACRVFTVVDGTWFMGLPYLKPIAATKVISRIAEIPEN